MSSATETKDPYHDEDADSIDMRSAPLDQEDLQSPILRSLKHVGETFRHGGFCSPRKVVLKKDSEHEPTKDVDTTVDHDSYSLSDDSNQGAVMKQKTVSFSDLLVEPLIVDEETLSEENNVETDETEETKNTGKETEDTKDENREKPSDEEEESKSEPFLSIKNEEKKKNTSKGSSFFLITVLLLVAVGGAIASYKEISRVEEAIDLVVKGYEKLSEIAESYFILLQSYFAETSIKSNTLTTSTVATLILMFILNMFLASERRMKALLEFLWGVFICTVVMIGVYFTYQHFES